MITVHSLEPLRPWKREQIGRGYDLSKWVEKTALEMADAVIAVSTSTRDDILRLFDVDPTKVPVIPNGIDTEEFMFQPEARDTVRASWGAAPGSLVVGQVGAFLQRRGYQIKVFNHLFLGITQDNEAITTVRVVARATPSGVAWAA